MNIKVGESKMVLVNNNLFEKVKYIFLFVLRAFLISMICFCVFLGLVFLLYFGDLIYYDSPYSADLIVPDFMEDSVEGIYEGMSTIILQDGQRIKDKYFVITANATYDANKSIGNIRSFELNDIIYTVYDSDKNAIRLEPAL